MLPGGRVMNYFIAGLVVGFSSMFFFSVGITTATEREWRENAISRGYAIHCPTDGRFAWKGECEGGG